MNTGTRPLVGVGILITKDEKILMGKRKNAHGDGTWAPPGGHLEYGETPQECARREVREETGLLVKNMQWVTFTNDIFADAHKQYITLYFVTEYISGTPTILEPDKCTALAWFSFHELPSPLFLSFENFLKQNILHSFAYHDIIRAQSAKSMATL